MIPLEIWLWYIDSIFIVIRLLKKVNKISDRIKFNMEIKNADQKSAFSNCLIVGRDDIHIKNLVFYKDQHIVVDV